MPRWVPINTELLSVYNVILITLTLLLMSLLVGLVFPNWVNPVPNR